MDSLQRDVSDVTMEALRQIKCLGDITSFFDKATEGELDIRYLEKEHIKQVFRSNGGLRMKMLSMLDDGKGTLFG